jgi:adenylate cyclase class 2
MTYKGPSILVQGVRQRQEIEFQVSNFEAAQSLLQALGYQVIVVYEKYRTQYNLQDVIVCLDELPFGHFVELEGPSPEAIRQVAGELHLNWDARILKSYLYLFQQVRDRLGLTFRDLTFENFHSIHVTPETLDVQPAIPG